MQRFLIFMTTVLAVCIVPSMGFMSSRTCFCDLKEGSDANNLRRYLDLDDHVRRRFLWVRCSVMRRECRDRCLDKAREELDVPSNTDIINLSPDSGRKLCERHDRTITPSNRKYLYLSYQASNCASRVNEYIGELCCWRCSFPGYPPMFFFNQNCQENPPATSCNSSHSHTIR